MTTIILNPKEAKLLDYEQNYKDLMSFEGYLSMLEQIESFKANQKGYEYYAQTARHREKSGFGM